MSDNLQIYEAVRKVPPEALKRVEGGKLTGKSSVNPMWRLKTLTEQFGACGIGWKYTIDRQWIEPAADGECAAFVDISLYFKHSGEWSEAIPGTGGSMLVQTERGKLASNDECYKMALTDAISVACKALGVAADVYWDSDRSKNSGLVTPICEVCGTAIKGAAKNGQKFTAQEVAERIKEQQGRVLCRICQQKAAQDES